jgi:hypothetical protein
MKDNMKLVEQQAAFLKDVAKLINEAARYGYVITGGELFRTQDQQDIYLKIGKSQIKHSCHQDRLAIDLNFFVKDASGNLALTYKKDIIEPLGKFWESLNPLNKWGGYWTSLVDTPHFQRNIIP